MSIKLSNEGKPVLENIGLLCVTMDVDGVFANFLELFYEKAFAVDGIRRDWRNHKDMVHGSDIPDEVYQKAWDIMIHTPNMWLMIPPFKDLNFDRLDNLMGNLTCKGYFVTHKANLMSGSVRDAAWLTKAWFEGQGVENQMGIVANHADRVAMVKILNSDIHIEDDPKNFKNVNAAGVTCYLIDRPWNQDCKAGDLRVYNLDEFLDHVEKEANRRRKEHEAQPER